MLDLCTKETDSAQSNELKRFWSTEYAFMYILLRLFVNHATVQISGRKTNYFSSHPQPIRVWCIVYIVTRRDQGRTNQSRFVGDRLKKFICFHLDNPFWHNSPFLPRTHFIYYNNICCTLFVVRSRFTIHFLEIKQQCAYTHTHMHARWVYYTYYAHVCVILYAKSCLQSEYRTVKTTCARGKMRLSCLRQTRARPSAWE